MTLKMNFISYASYGHLFLIFVFNMLGWTIYKSDVKAIFT